MSNDNIVGELSFYYNKLPYTSRVELPDAIVLYEINDIFASGTTDIIGKVNIQTTIYKHDTTNIGKIEEIYVFSTGSFEVVFLIDDISQDGKFKQNQLYYGQVVAGSGNFLGSVGTASVFAETDKRDIKVTFNKVWDYPLETSK